METTKSIDIDVPPSAAWAVLADLENWPTWTGSVKKLEVLDGGPLRQGTRARVELLGAPMAGDWTVTSVTDGREFTWENRAPGVHTVATHVIEAHEAGSRVTLGIRQSGPGAWFMRPWFKHVNNRNMDMEAAGLKKAAESVFTNAPVSAGTR